MWIISRVFGESRYTRLTFITTLIQCLTVITFEAIIYVYHTQEVNVLSTEQFNNTNGVEYANARSLSVYHILFMIAQLFMVGMFIDAIYQKNTIQLIALVCFEFGMTIYSGIQYRQAATLFDNAAAKATIIAIIEAKLGMFHQSYWAELMVVATMVVFMLIFTAFAYKLYQEFGWSIYKKIGADLAMRDVYKMYQIFMMLLKFDVFFFLSLSIQYLVVLVVRGNTAGANFNLSSLLIKHILLSTIVTVVMMVLAFWGLKSERRTVLYSFMVCGVCSMAYFIYLLVDVNNNPDFYEGSRTFLTFFLAVCIALIVITLVISVFCTRNFGKGLKYHITHANGSTSTSLHRLRPLPGGEKPETTTNSDNGRRWSIE